ncbi:MAG TPA: ABC transporter ATP-binding protein [Acidimicrobiia bacterium]|nr:ABC transporter ATP-binding protein [Acidimicrobiia bacterium]
MTLLQVEDLTTWFHTGRGVLKAVNNVSFDLEKGKTLGLVGESGSGKSVLTRSVMGIQTGSHVARAAGRVIFDGVDLRALSAQDLRDRWGTRIAIVPQNPLSSLNPVVKIGRQVTEILTRRMGMPKRAAERRALELLSSVGIPSPERRLKQYPHQLSGGMRQRVVIAMALAGEPDLLIADEPTTALDVTIQAQILVLLRTLQTERHMAMIFVSHDLAVVSSMADDIAVMYAGRIVERSTADIVLHRPLMPYTEALITSIPRLDHARHQLLPVIPGRPPDLVDIKPGCPFHPRCARRGERCDVDRPPIEGSPEHQYACWYPVERDAS